VDCSRAGLEAGSLRTKMFRHTYCAARLQTLDRGAPVSTYTVARELGHESEAMVRRVYAHLGEVRHRSEVVVSSGTAPPAGRRAAQKTGDCYWDRYCGSGSD